MLVQSGWSPFCATDRDRCDLKHFRHRRCSTTDRSVAKSHLVGQVTSRIALEAADRRMRRGDGWTGVCSLTTHMLQSTGKKDKERDRGTEGERREFFLHSSPLHASDARVLCFVISACGSRPTTPGRRSRKKMFDAGRRADREADGDSVRAFPLRLSVLPALFRPCPVPT